MARKSWFWVRKRAVFDRGLKNQQHLWFVLQFFEIRREWGGLRGPGRYGSGRRWRSRSGPMESPPWAERPRWDAKGSSPQPWCGLLDPQGHAFHQPGLLSCSFQQRCSAFSMYMRRSASATICSGSVPSRGANATPTLATSRSLRKPGVPRLTPCGTTGPLFWAVHPGRIREGPRRTRHRPAAPRNRIRGKPSAPSLPV